MSAFAESPGGQLKECCAGERLDGEPRRGLCEFVGAS